MIIEHLQSNNEKEALKVKDLAGNKRMKENED
jgi:hypothetical protein